MAKTVYPDAPKNNMQNNQKSNERWSVYGDSHYVATGVYSKGPWEPAPLKGVSSYPPDTDLTLDNFLKEYEEIIQCISNTPVDQRNPQHVTFLLHTVFPHLENKIAKSGRTVDILDIILKLSCVKQCPVVTRYALHMILETLSKTSYDSGGMFNDFLLRCESCLRDSLLDISIFDYENAEDQGLRIFVYSRSLMILYANIVQGTIPLANMEKNFDVLFEKVCDLEGQIFFEEKDKPRYAIRCIKETIARISSIKKKDEVYKNPIYKFLIWLKKYNSKGEKTKDQRNDSVKHFLSKIKTSKKGWFDFHAALFCLGSQIHKKPQNREILESLVGNYIKQHSDCCSKWTSEGEWQTGLVLGSVLEDILNYNHDRDTRAHACLCLITCFTHLTKQNSLEKLKVQESLQRSLYGPNKDLRRVVLDHLELGERKTRKEGVTRETMNEHIPITHSMEHLVQKYKKQLLPSSQDFKMRNNLKGYFSASFRGEDALVKILETTKDDFVREERIGPSKIQQQLVIEAYTLRRLNSKPHPNILRVFAYDTSAQPYHLITEMVSEGSLLQFLHSLRSRAEPMPVPSVLLEMMFGVIEAVIYLNERNLVHLSIMADNVLVSHDNVCKLTGFQFAREMIKQRSGNYEYISVHDETATRHAAPESLENGCFSEKSVSWAIGIMLFEMHTYGVSPYNQYSNDQADQIRSHVISRGKLQMADCIRREVCEVIKMCLTYEKEDRPSLAQLRTELERVHKQIIEGEKDWAAVIYPALTNVDLAQTKNAMNSSRALEELDNQKNLGYFGTGTTSIDRPTIRNYDGETVIRELVLKTMEDDLEKLLFLKHENVVNVISLSDHDNKNVALVTEYSGLGNLLQQVLAKNCQPEQLVTFVTQISQGLRYLHDNYMIHGDLRAEYIMVFPNNKVKVSRLGRSKAVGQTFDTKCRMPQDAIRWSPPEVITDGIYSHSSDIYSFGLMCYELFEALDAPAENEPDYMKPFNDMEDNQVLARRQANELPARSECMPIWVHIVVKQCLLHRPSERPQFVLIEDALTSGKPFESCLLSHWLSKHQSEADNIDVNVTQSVILSHVIPKERHKTFEELRQLVSDEVFQDHAYASANKDEDPYEEIYSEPPSEGIYKNPRYERPLPLLPTPTLPKPVQESGDKLDRAYSEIALYSPSSPSFNIKASSPSLDDQETPYYENINQDNKANASLFTGPPLPSPTNRLQQDIDEYPIWLSSSSDDPCSAENASPYPEQNVQSVPGEPVERSCQFSMHQPENQGNEYVSMASYDLGATKSSWHTLIPQNDEQQDGSSSNEKPDRHEYISMARNDLRATEGSWHF